MSLDCSNISFDEESLEKPNKKKTKETRKNKKKQRKRNVLWFNPPFNQNVTNNIGQMFLNIVDKHFGKERKDKLNKIFKPFPPDRAPWRGSM